LLIPFGVILLRKGRCCDSFTGFDKTAGVALLFS
jgi:hypothetical protein